MKSYRIAAIGGDGIGPEVIAAGLEALEVCAKRDGGFRFDVKNFDWGSDRYKRHGLLMPAGGVDELRAFDAIYFGAVGAPDVPDHVTLWGLRLAICQGLDQYANVRPTRILPGITGPLRNVSAKDLDWVIVRENSEGEYAGQGGRSHKGLPEEVATEVAIFTRAGVARIMRFAFALASSRPRKHLTVVTKSNAQRHGMVLWDEIAAEVGRVRGGVCRHALDGAHQPFGRARLAEMVEHHHAGPEGADRVGDALADDIEGRAMDRLEHRREFALRVEVCGRCDAKRSRECRREI
jgi:tartrate dehydrogenase/decarboxylase / D-malate dehydrogenase